MYWLIGGLVILVLVLIIISVMMLIAVECKEGLIVTQRNEYQKLMCKYERILTQVGEHGYSVRISYSDSIELKLKKENEHD